MGISGLLPFLKNSSQPVSIKDFKGCTVAVDSYCWLHKGAFSCAEKLAMGEKTNQYVYYCMKYVNSLLSFGIKPIMVFDGCHLPSKREEETKRRERREANRKKAAHFLREGMRSEARECLQRCIDITPQMALDLMNACRDKGVDCIVAPYEADAQLAYLNKCGIAQIIITEDSDLLLFGCERVIFKMDFNGNGIMIESKNLHVSMGLRSDLYTFDKFRYMCILSGCDYLPSLPGIGLGKANKLFQVTRQDDMNLMLRKMPTTLKMGSLTVPSGYIKGFFRANNTFLYQLVFDPMKRKLVPLNPYPPEVEPSEMEYAGPHIESTKAYQIALGNLDLHTGEKIGNFDPDTFKPKKTINPLGKEGQHLLYMQSIWHKSYRPMPKNGLHPKKQEDLEGSVTAGTKGKQTVVSAGNLFNKRSQLKRKHQEVSEDDDQQNDENVLDLYPNGPLSSSSKKLCFPQEDPNLNDIPNAPECSDERDDPANKLQGQKISLQPSHNIFAVHGKAKKTEFHLDAPKGNTVTKSRFFVKEETKPAIKESSFLNCLKDGSTCTDKESPANHDDNPILRNDYDENKETPTKTCHEDSANTDVPSVISNNCDVKPENSSSPQPHGSFNFKNKLNMFKSNYDINKVTYPCTSNSYKTIKKVSLKQDGEPKLCIGTVTGHRYGDHSGISPVKRKDPLIAESDSCIMQETSNPDSQESLTNSSQHSNLYSIDTESVSYSQFLLEQQEQNSVTCTDQSVVVSHPTDTDMVSSNQKGAEENNITVCDLTGEDSNEASEVNMTSLTTSNDGQHSSRSNKTGKSKPMTGCRSVGLSRKQKGKSKQKENQDQPALTKYFSKYSFGGSNKPKVASLRSSCSLPLSPSKEMNTNGAVPADMDKLGKASLCLNL